MSIFLVILAVLLSWTGVFAGPLEGELFGYKLGSKYPATDDTQVAIHSFLRTITVVADNPEKSDNFQRVELIITPYTYTIGRIYGIAELASEKEAKDMASHYADLLKTLHGEQCPEEEGAVWKTLRLICSGEYELEVYHSSPKGENKHQVYIDLGVTPESSTGKDLVAQNIKEWAQLETEGKLYRLEQAIKEGKLSGLQ
jgi:hypothetical protein